MDNRATVDLSDAEEPCHGYFQNATEGLSAAEDDTTTTDMYGMLRYMHKLLSAVKSTVSGVGFRVYQQKLIDATRLLSFYKSTKIMD
jgi:hypothetical protein